MSMTSEIKHFKITKGLRKGNSVLGQSRTEHLEGLQRLKWTENNNNYRHPR